ncbi:MAG: hypothetical protein WC089_01800 [Candidatus Paceibacterota bacterium]
MDLKILCSESKELDGGTCSGSSCPTIYESSNGSIIVQGFKITNEERNTILIPQGEDMVVIPKSLIEKIIKRGI